MTGFNLDTTLIAKYNINGPRYTSYPTALQLRESDDIAPTVQALESSVQPLSLYIHLPFCVKLCYYCGCNKVITRHQGKADTYLDALQQEMKLVAPFIQHRPIRNLHLGGGTPTFLNEQQLSRLHQLLMAELNFDFDNADEVSIEIDPRSCSVDKLAHLRSLGFNRVSYGVQDFNDEVQIAINRVQSEALVVELVEKSKELGYESVNLDLVYGLPLQTTAGFETTLNKVIGLSPDRISLFSYAHLPQRFPAQRKIPDHTLPAGEVKQNLLLTSIEKLGKAGYQFIGMDHFAKSTDSLANAQREGRMQRNFQGYTTHGSDSLLGLGASSISQVSGELWQNAKDLKTYYEQIAEKRLPIIKRASLTNDDKVRASVIAQLICHFELGINEFSQRWDINFWDYFGGSRPRLEEFQRDGLISIDAENITVTQAGRLWVRVICSAFDAYLNEQPGQYSKVI